MTYRPVLRSPLDCPLRHEWAASRSMFNPAFWFAGGEQGVMLESYDPNTILKRRNLLTWSEDFSNAAWNKVDTTVTANATAAPNGEMTADLLTTGTLATDNISQSVTLTAGGPARWRLCLKRGNHDWVRVQASTSDGSTAGFRCWVNLATGLKGQESIIGVGTLTSATVTPLADGWVEVDLRGTVPAGTALLAFVMTCLGDGVTTRFSNGTRYQWGAQLEYGASAYQRVTDWNTEYLAADAGRISLWQDSTGTTPVTAVEQPVGLRLDTKRGLVRGPEVWDDATATFMANASRVSPGVYRIFSPTGAETGDILQVGVLVANQWYEVTFNIDSVAAAGGGIRVGGATTAGVVVAATVGLKRCLVQAENASSAFKRVSGITDLQISNVSFKRLPADGNHSWQSTAASRSILSARVNQLIKSQEFDNAAWNKVGTPTITPNAGIAPDGTQTADLIARITTAATYFGQNGYTKPAAAMAFRFRIWAKKSIGDTFAIRLQGTYPARMDAVINLVNGATSMSATATGGFSAGSVSTTPAAGGYWVTLNATTDTATVITAYAMFNQNGGQVDSIDSVSNSAGYVWGADLRYLADVAPGIPPYQFVNTATDYDTDGFPHFILRDGIDDRDATGTLTVSGDKVTLLAGVTKLNDAAAGAIMEYGPNSDTTPGTFSLFAAGIPVGAEPAGRLNYSARIRGDTGVNTTDAYGHTSAHSGVLCATLDIAGATQGTENAFEVNGVPGTQYNNATLAGAGALSNQTLTFGARADGSLWFNGRDYGVVVCFAAKTAAQRLQAAKWMAARMGRSL